MKYYYPSYTLGVDMTYTKPKPHKLRVCWAYPS